MPMPAGATVRPSAMPMPSFWMQGQANYATQLRCLIYGLWEMLPTAAMLCYLQQPCCRWCVTVCAPGEGLAGEERATTTNGRGRPGPTGCCCTTSGPPPPDLLSVRRSPFPLCQEEREENARGGRPGDGRRRRGGTTMDFQGRAAVGVFRGDACMLGFGCAAGRCELSTTEQLPH